MPSQRLPPLHIASPVGDVPAYPAYEIDRGTYGTLRTVMRSRRGGQQRRFIDIGANLGTYSIALALANPDAVGLALEPNPVTFAFLQRNLEANGVRQRVRPVHAGVSEDGRPLSMPRCVVNSDSGSQMASTQWQMSERHGHAANRSRSASLRMRNVCFSEACRSKAADVARCLQSDSTMITVRSYRLATLLGLRPITHTTPNNGQGQASNPTPATPEQVSVDLLKVDCEGCEYQSLDVLARAVGAEAGSSSAGSGRGGDGGSGNGALVGKLFGECHALAGTTEVERQECMRLLRGTVCEYGVLPWLACRGPPVPRPDEPGESRNLTGHRRHRGPPLERGRPRSWWASTSSSVTRWFGRL